MVCGPVHIIKHYRIKGMPKRDTFVAVLFHATCINVRLIFTIRYFDKSIYFRNISIIVSASETRSHSFFLHYSLDDVRIVHNRRMVFQRSPSLSYNFVVFQYSLGLPYITTQTLFAQQDNIWSSNTYLICPTLHLGRFWHSVDHMAVYQYSSGLPYITPETVFTA